MTLDQVPAGAHVFVDANILVYHFQPHPGFGPSLPSYWTNATFQYGSSPLVFQLMVTGCQTLQTVGDMYSGTMVVMGNHDDDASSSFFQRAPTALTVRYTGTGSGNFPRITSPAIFPRA